MNEIKISFENWQKALRETVPVRFQTTSREAITKYRYWLWENGKTANVTAFKEHLAWRTEKACRNLPAVLTRGDCARFFAKLAGTTRLMAELTRSPKSIHGRHQRSLRFGPLRGEEALRELSWTTVSKSFFLCFLRELLFIGFGIRD